VTDNVFSLALQVTAHGKAVALIAKNADGRSVKVNL
jgi:hypothetical protein